MTFDPNEKQSVIICKRKQYETYQKSAKKAKDKLHKACERASETLEQTLHRQEHNRIIECAWQAQESHETVINSS